MQANRNLTVTIRKSQNSHSSSNPSPQWSSCSSRRTSEAGSSESANRTQEVHVCSTFSVRSLLKIYVRLLLRTNQLDFLVWRSQQ